MHVESQEINKWNPSIKGIINEIFKGNKVIINNQDFFCQKQEEKNVLD
jgi:hypothetical protein